MNLVHKDAIDHHLEPARFDLVVLFHHLDCRLFPRIITALKPGGLIFCKLRSRGHSGAGPKSNRDQLLNPDELLTLLPGVDVIDYKQRLLDKNRSVVESMKIQAVRLLWAFDS
jgi:hypothetical protein